MLSLALGLAAGCGLGGETLEVLDQRAEMPEKLDPEVGIQFVQPEFTVPAASEVMVCWIPDWVPDQDYLVNQFVGHQGSMGHHVVALRSGIPRQAGSTFDCTELESMTSLEPLILPDPEGEKLLPDGFAVRLPKDSRIVIQSHYVNATQQDILVRDVAELFFHPEGETATEANYLIMNHGALDLPTGVSSAQKNCTVPDDLNLLLFLPHMHDWGRTFSLDHVRSDATTNLIQIDEWTVDFRDDPPITFFDHQDPFVVQGGDRIEMNCGFDNTTGEKLTFPQEMCTAVAYYYPARDVDPTIICDE
jgi:hypothetical protein